MPRLLVVLLLLLAAPAAAQGDLIRPTDLFQIRELSSVEVSPDGRHALYTVRQVAPDPAREGRRTYRTHVWLGPLDGSAPPRPLTHGDASASDPTWHPSGDRVAFVRAHDGRPQVWVLPLMGGEAYRVTALPHGASAPRFAPDGLALLVASSLPWSAMDTIEAAPPWPSERPARRYRDLAPGAEPDPDGPPEAVRAWLDRQPPAIVQPTTRLNFQGEQGLQPEPAFRHLYVVELHGAEGGTVPPARPLTQGWTATGDGAWTPDGRHVLFTASAEPSVHPDEVRRQALFLVPAGGGAPERLLALDGWTLSEPTPSPDGRHVAFRGGRLEDEGFQEAHLGVLDRRTGAVRWVTDALDRSAGPFAFAPGGGHLYVVAAADGGFPLFRVALGEERPRPERLTPADEGVRSFGVGPGALAYVRTAVENPFELWAGDEAVREPVRLSAHNTGWLAGRRLSLPDHRQLTRDTLRVDYWVMPPADLQPGRRYPVLLQIHGGPSAMWGPGEASMWHEFQVFAARGYGVVYANPRGSGGYGLAFRRANYRDWGEGPAGDVLAALDAALASEPWADPDRLAVTGGSYAGYLTAWIVAHDHRFRAAVAQRGVYDLPTFLGEGNAWRLVPTHFGGFPWDEDAADVLRQQSPLTYVDRIRTPLLVKHGSEDLRTGVSQSEMLYRSLRLLGRPVEYARYPGAGHDMSRTGDPDQRLDRLLRIYEFIERHVRG